MCLVEAWDQAVEDGFYKGSDDDLADGFIHFSTAQQVAESAARHRAGVAGLLLIGVAPETLGDALKWEPSRGGQLFPHVYGGFQVALASLVEELPLDENGRHVFPPDIPPFVLEVEP